MSAIRRGSSVSSRDDNLSTNVHFKWSSIKSFLYIAFTFSTNMTHTELFSFGENEARIFEYLIIQLTIGMTYLFMDFFIKQYTRRIDFMAYLNPLMKGIMCGCTLQAVFMAYMNATCLGDTIKFLIISFKRPPDWKVCPANTSWICIPTEDVDSACQRNRTLIHLTSNHHFYKTSFVDADNTVATSRSFIAGTVWITIFFCSTLNDHLFVKTMKISFIWSLLSTGFTLTFASTYLAPYRYKALLGIFNITSQTTFLNAVNHAAHTCAIGLIGLHDYGSMSPYTVVDNTVVTFMIFHMFYSLCQALIQRILILGVSRCIKIPTSMSEMGFHYRLYTLMPLSIHFLPLEHLHSINLYLTTAIRCATYVSMITVTIARMLHNEFRSIRIVYIIGLLCAMGFLFSLTHTMNIMNFIFMLGMRRGLNIAILLLGSYKVALIMYIYGVKKFTTDIHFWLGFNPTKFWTLNWMMTPILLFTFFLSNIAEIPTISDGCQIPAMLWLGLTLIVVLSVNLKTIIKYIQKNNFMGIFKAHPKYGPFDREFLKKRKVYNETLKHKICKHNCIVYDESYTECDHEWDIGEYTSSMLIIDDETTDSSVSLDRLRSTLKSTIFSRTTH